MYNANDLPIKGAVILGLAIVATIGLVVGVGVTALAVWLF